MTRTVGTSSHSLWPLKRPVAQTLPFKTTKVNEPKLPSLSAYLYLYLYLRIPITTDPVRDVVAQYIHHFASWFQTTQRGS